MTLTGFVCMTLVVLLPLILLLWRRHKPEDLPVTARVSALSLYRHQLQELDRDRKNGLLGDDERARAELEIQRRILLADRLVETKTTIESGQKRRLILLLVMLPCFGFTLYLINGHPSLPAQPHKVRQVVVPADMLALFEKLAKQVAAMTPDDPDFVRQSVLLGQVDEAMGHPDAALHAYRQALAVAFIPELAVQIAELQTRQEGHISADSLALYCRALDAAPPDAPWRLAVEARIATGEHDLAR
ncbi:c-type cytochrome biogenesis protein CcmI [Asaia prunellae]|uniref:c-type cytochrome biogenesis protein CcmI n=1 Tax=Asaia prunellae TaxID=610245 RepID=UPI00046FC608|nr:c-type cytochrome biogenesis protein CcmI [Asaia prunellae]